MECLFHEYLLGYVLDLPIFSYLDIYQYLGRHKPTILHLSVVNYFLNELSYANALFIDKISST
jgi:hypothetical protein